MTEMQKRVTYTIYSCIECVWFQQLSGSLEPTCGKIGSTRNKRIEHMMSLPDWCPLPNVEESD